MSNRVTLPGDLRAYFSAADGSGDVMDPDLKRFWPLEEVKPVHEGWSDIDPGRFGYPGCYLIADHFFSDWDYAVRIDEGAEASGPVFRVTGKLPVGEPMAASFVAFIEMYLADPDSIL